jgi:hypothetical protein
MSLLGETRGLLPTYLEAPTIPDESVTGFVPGAAVGLEDY